MTPKKAIMTHPNQQHLDVPQCPNGHGDMQKAKEWEVKGKGDKGFWVELWKCPQCNQSFRRTRKGEPTQ